jgi:hypothetical protein
MDYFKNLGFGLVLVGTVLLAACGSTPQFTDVRDREWKLAAVRTEAGNNILDRDQLIAGGFEDVFTLRFADMASGRGAPNRYSGPYEAGKGNAGVTGTKFA